MGGAPESGLHHYNICIFSPLTANAIETYRNIHWWRGFTYTRPISWIGRLGEVDVWGDNVMSHHVPSTPRGKWINECVADDADVTRWLKVIYNPKRCTKTWHGPIIWSTYNSSNLLTIWDCYQNQNHTHSTRRSSGPRADHPFKPVNSVQVYFMAYMWGIFNETKTLCWSLVKQNLETNIICLRKIHK